MEILLVLCGLAIGFFAAWFAINIRAKELNKNIKYLEQSHERLATTFQALSGEALKSNNRAFLELAKESLGIVLSDTKGVVKPLEDALKRYECQISDLEKSRLSAYVSLEGQIKSLITTQEQLQRETGNLVTALRRPEVRGRWGEITLKRVVELIGMSEHCDYVEQVSVETDEGRLRPDMIVYLPNDREIVVDSKVPLDAYLDAVNAQNEDSRKAFLTKHSQQVRRHMRDLSEKNYWAQFPKAPEFVVMFIPGEVFLSAALENDHSIYEDGIKSNVVIASPMNLVAILKTIAYEWRQEQISENVKEIATLGKELYERFHPFLGHVNKLGSNLRQVVSAFNEMTSSLERRILVSVRKFRELGATGDKELPDVEPVEQIPMKADEETKAVHGL